MGWREDLHASYAGTLDEYMKKLSAYGIGRGAGFAARTGAAGTRRGGAAHTREALYEGFRQQAAATLAGKLASAEAGEAARMEREQEVEERARGAATWGLLGKLVGGAAAIPIALTGNVPLAGTVYSAVSGIGGAVQQAAGGYPSSQAEMGPMAEMMRLMEYRKWLDEYLGGGATAGGGYDVPTPPLNLSGIPGGEWAKPGPPQ